MAGLSAFLLPGADAAQRVVARIDGFGPYMLGMTLDQARAAHKGAKQTECGEIASARQCLVLNAEVFEEPAVIYAVLNEAGDGVDRIVARLDPQRTRRRAYRCVRLSEKVFALLVVVYGSKYKQSYDQNRRPLPAVAWDGEEAGRLVFEPKCRTPDEGDPRISVMEHYPDGVKPPPVAQKDRTEPEVAAAPPATASAPAAPTVDASAPAASVPLSVEGLNVAPTPSSARSTGLALSPNDDQPPVPLTAPIGVVEEIRPEMSDTSGAVDANAAMAALARELAHAKGKKQSLPLPAALPAEPVPGPADPQTAAAPSVPPSVPAAAQPVAGAQAPEGTHVVPVDIVPPSAETRSAATVAIGPAAVAAPPVAVPSVAAVDPGPVTLPAPSAEREPVPGPATPPSEPSIAAAPEAAAGPEAAQPPFPQPYAPRVRAQQTAALPPEIRAPSYREPGALSEPTDLEAPEAFTVPEDEDVFRRRREAPEMPEIGDAPPRGPTVEAEVRRRLTVASTAAEATVPAPVAAAEPIAPRREDAATPPLTRLSAGHPGPTKEDAARPDPAPVPALQVPAGAGSRQPPATVATAPPSAEVPSRAAKATQTARTVGGPNAPAEAELTSPAAREKREEVRSQYELQASTIGTWGRAEEREFAPVMSGGWRHRAPVPPSKPWRERQDAQDPAVSGL